MAGLEGTVNAPGLGKVPKKEAVIGAVVVGTLAVVHYVRKKKATTAAPAATSADQYPPDGTTGNPSDPYSTDPATGQTYGNEATGSGGTFGAYGGLGGSNSSGGGGSGSGTGGTSSGGPPFSNNQAWSSYVLQTLEANNPGQDPGALADAIGVYLNGQPVTPTQQTLVFDAIAVGGDPPTAGTNGFPPKVQVTGSNGPGTGPHPTGPPVAANQVKVPVTFGMRAEAAISKIEAAGLTVSTQPARNPKDTYVSTGSSPESGTRVAKGSHVTLNVKAGK